MTDEDDTGFDAVLAGNVYVAPPSDGAIYAEVSKRQFTPEEIAEQDEAIAKLTATVSEEPPATPQQVSDAGKALVQLPPLDMVTLAKLAREIAMDIKETAVVLKEFGLSNVQYEYLSEHNTVFKNALEAACLEWQSPMATKDRVSAAAAAILEDSLPTLGARMQNKAEGLPGVTETAKFFAKIAGIGEREHSGAPSGERFVINIDLGGDQKVTLQAGDTPTPTQAGQPALVQPVADPPRARAFLEEVRRQPEAEGNQAPVRSEPEGA